MLADRRPYRREAEEKRRDDLIAAALELVADGGLQAATVRAIADRAGVTPGLIRHYFTSKEDLTRAAYRQIMERMTAENARALDDAPDDPVARLAIFVAASLRPPVLDAITVGVWAAYMQQARNDPTVREIHASTYLGYRDLLQDLISALPRPADAVQLRREAIACNAVIDGLWIEGGSLPEGFAPGELPIIGLTSVGAILGVDLLAAHPADPATKSDV
jgi:TetR/AcrR family transcriptional regulator, transcriptional repressor of bet genes